MADGMSFDRYIDNPSGGSVFTNRNIYKNMYRRKFGNVLVREQGQIKYTVYKSGDAFDSYYIHIKVPSEVIDNFYYDVVIRLFTDVNEKKNNANLREYAVQFYSNDPAFVYTFANTFYKRKLFINDLKPIKEKAEIRNPGNNVWYVKSLFFAYLIMEKYSLFQRAMLDQHAKKYKKAELLRNITQAETKIADRQKAQKQLDDEKRKEKERAIIERQKQLRTQQSHSTKIAKATKISRVSTTTKVSKVSRASKITPKR